MKKRSPTKVMEGESSGVNTSVNYQPSSVKG